MTLLGILVELILAQLLVNALSVATLYPASLMEPVNLQTLILVLDLQMLNVPVTTVMYIHSQILTQIPLMFTVLRPLDGNPMEIVLLIPQHTMK
jgi:hypothetical protein